MTFDVRNDGLDATIRDALRWRADRAPDLAPPLDQAMQDLARNLGGGDAAHRDARRTWVVLAAAALLLTLLIGTLAIGTGLIRLPWVTEEPEIALLGAFDRSEMEILFDAEFEDEYLIDGLLLYRTGLSGVSVDFAVDADSLAIVRSSGRVSFGGFIPRPALDDGIMQAWFGFLGRHDKEAAEWLRQQLAAFLSASGSEMAAVEHFGRIRAEFRTAPNFMNGGSHDTATWQVQVAPGTQFSGFLPPVADDGFNVASVGQPIPLRWRLTDAAGYPILDLATVGASVVERDCDRADTTHRVDEYATGTDLGLQNLGDGVYQYNYAAPSAYAGTCKTLRLNLGEGYLSFPMYRTLDFQFVE